VLHIIVCARGKFSFLVLSIFFSSAVIHVLVEAFIIPVKPLEWKKDVEGKQLVFILYFLHGCWVINQQVIRPDT